MSKVVIISGSPSESSRIDLVLQHVQAMLEHAGISVLYKSVSEFSPEDLFYARFNSPSIKSFSAEIEQADGVIIGSPVYKASYTGVLKALLDLLPERALQATPVLPLMVGGSKAHLLAIEFALKPLIHNLKGVPSQGIYFVDSQIDKENKLQPLVDHDCALRLQEQLGEFIESLQPKKQYIS